MLIIAGLEDKRRESRERAGEGLALLPLPPHSGALRTTGVEPVGLASSRQAGRARWGAQEKTGEEALLTPAPGLLTGGTELTAFARRLSVTEESPQPVPAVPDFLRFLVEFLPPSNGIDG